MGLSHGMLHILRRLRNTRFTDILHCQSSQTGGDAMTDAIDAFSDQFTVTIGPLGASLTFSVNVPHPEPTAPKAAERVATIRMSVEHLKLMAVIIVRQVKKIEADSGVSYQIPNKILAQLGVGPEDWESFWSR